MSDIILPSNTARPRTDDLATFRNLAAGGAIGAMNAATGMGVPMYDPGAHANIAAGVIPLDRGQQDRLVRSHKLIRKFVEIIPDQMTYRWGKLTLGGDDGDTDTINEVHTWLNKIQTRSLVNRYQGLERAFNQAMKLAFQTGNAALVILAKDGQNFDRPINKNNLKSIEGLFLADRWSIQPDISGIYANLEMAEYFWLNDHRFNKIIQMRGTDTGRIRIHRSRVLWFRGEELSDRTLLENQGCDDSVLQGIHQSFQEYFQAVRGAGRMIVDFDVVVHGVNGLLERLDNDPSGKYQQKMMERAQINNLCRSIWRSMIIDKEEEEIVHSTRNVSGYDSLLDRLVMDLQANTDLTKSELFNDYSKGLSATDKVEQQNANDRTSRYQKSKLDSNLYDFLTLVFLSKDGPTGGKTPDVWDWHWHALYPVTPVEQAELELMRSQIDQINSSIGAYTGEEAAKSHYSGSEYNPEITIDWKEREKLKAEQEKLQAEQDKLAIQMGLLPGMEQPLLPGQPKRKALPPPQVEEELPTEEEAKTDSDEPFVPPLQVQAIARKGLELFKRYGSPGKPNIMQSVFYSRHLAYGQPIPRNAVFYIKQQNDLMRIPPGGDNPKNPSPEFISYLCRGGAPGQAWIEQLIKEIAIEEQTLLQMDGDEISVHMDKPCGKGFIKDNFHCSTEGILSSATVAVASGVAAYLMLKDAPSEIRVLSSIGVGMAVGGVSNALLSSAEKAQKQKPKMVEDIQYDNFGRPLFPQKNGWKPEMSLAEAEEWTKNSVIQESVFHGTTSANAVSSIRSQGFDLEEAVRGELSDGVYLTRHHSEALNYTKDKDRKISKKRVLEVRPNIVKPLLLGSNYQYHFPGQAIEAMGQNSLMFQYAKAHRSAILAKTERERLSSSEEQIVLAKAQRDTLRTLGFDGIYTSNLDWVVAFDPTSVTVINSKRSDRTDEEEVHMDKPCGEGFISNKFQCRIAGFGNEKYVNYKTQKIGPLLEIRSGRQLTYIDRSLEIETPDKKGVVGIAYDLTDPIEVKTPKGGDRKVLSDAYTKSGGAFEISFYVYELKKGNLFSRDRLVSSGMEGVVSKLKFDKEQKLKMARAAKKIGVNVLKNVPENTLLINKPIGGARGARARIYENMGFSRIEGGQQYQYAVMGGDGKLMPLQVYKQKVNADSTFFDNNDSDIALWYEALFNEPMPQNEHPSNDKKSNLEISVHDDALKFEHVAAGVGGAAAIGAGAYLLNRTLEQNQKKKGEKCGESYISSRYTCHVSGGEESETLRQGDEEIISPENREIMRFATDPKVIPLTKEENIFLDPKTRSFGSKENINKIKAYGATNEEANALVGYLEYNSKSMNQYFYNRDRIAQAHQDRVKAWNKGAINALKRIPSITEEVIQTDIQREKRSGGWGEMGKDLIHNARIADQKVLDEIVKTYSRAKEEGTEIPLEKFLSTTYYQPGLPEFKEKSTMEIRITPKLDGKGGGKVVDEFKNAAREWEVLYIPGSRFKVKSVENPVVRTIKKKNGDIEEGRYLTIHLEEV
jgi:phage-related protein (TIGR01555 family)